MIGDERRSVWRISDILQALRSYVWTATASGREVDMVALGHLCLAFGIDIEDLAQPVRLMRQQVRGD
jgi:hypothetical protein